MHTHATLAGLQDWNWKIVHLSWGSVRVRICDRGTAPGRVILMGEGTQQQECASSHQAEWHLRKQRTATLWSCLLSQQMMVCSWKMNVYRVEEITFASHSDHWVWYFNQCDLFARWLQSTEQYSAYMILFLLPSLFQWFSWLEDRDVRSEIVVMTEWMKPTDPRNFPRKKKDKY